MVLAARKLKANLSGQGYMTLARVFFVLLTLLLAPSHFAIFVFHPFALYFLFDLNVFYLVLWFRPL